MRVVVSVKSYIGDAVLAEPVVRSLDEFHVEPVIYGSRLVAEVLDREVVVPSLNRKWRAAVVQGRQLRRLNSEAILLINRSFRSALAARLSGMPVRIGHATERRKFLLTHSFPYSKQGCETSCYLELLKPLSVPQVAPIPQIECDPSQSRIGKGLKTVGLQPGARYEAKQIPIPTLQFVAKSLAESGFEIVLMGGNDEVEAANRFLDGLPIPVTNLVGQLSISEAKATLAGLDRIVGSDTGLMHLAAAVGCPTLTVFGPNPSSKWGHHYEPHLILDSPGGNIREIPAESILQKLPEYWKGKRSLSPQSH